VLAVTAEPTVPAIRAPRNSVEEPATALEEPVRVSVQMTAPAGVTVGLLQEAEKPLGRPEATLMLDPLAPVGTFNPPVGVAVTVTVAEESDCMESEVGETAN
jgi:hypothetical protein